MFFDLHHRAQITKMGRQTVQGVLISLLVLGAFGAQAKTVGLLVGVGQFQSISPLEGPVNDVAAMREVLVKNLGVRAADIRQLTDAQATRQAVLKELQGLMQRTQPGDRVVLYFSTHGTSAYDPMLREALGLPYSTGALVMHDSQMDDAATMLVGRTDLRPIFQALDQGQRKVWVISDACYSGQLVRSLGGGSAIGTLPGRHIALAAEQLAQLSDSMPLGRPEPPPYPYKNVSFFSASSEGEIARDIQLKFLAKYPTQSTKPQGAFTDALVRVLSENLHADYDGNGQIDEAEVFASASQFMAERGYGHQPLRLPSLHEDTQGLSRQVVMQAKNPPQAPAASVQAQSAFRLGVANDIPHAVVERIRGLQGVVVVSLDDPSAELKLTRGAGADGAIALRTKPGDLIAQVLALPWTAEVQGMFEQQVWAKQIKQLGEQGRRGILHAEITPSHFGGNFVIGDKLAFAVRPDKPAYMLLVNVDASGKVSVLYPYAPAERAPLAGGITKFIPGNPQTEGINVEEPVGVDMQFLFAFDQDHAELEALRGLLKLSVQDPRLRALPTVLHKAKNSFTMLTTELRTHAVK